MKKWFITICACLLLASLLISFSSVMVGCGDDTVAVTVYPTATNTPSPTNTPSVTATPTGGTINVTVQ